MSTIHAAFALAIVLGARAQEPSPATRPVSDAQAARSPDQALADLAARYDERQKQFIEAWRAAQGDEERKAAMKLQPGAEFVAEFRALAESAPKTEAAAKAWLWVLRLGSMDKAGFTQAVDTLLANHLESPSLDEMAQTLTYAGRMIGDARAEEALRLLLEKSPHATVRAASLFALASVASEREGEEARKAARELFSRLLTEYGDLKARGEKYSDLAEGYIFKLDHLQPGMVVPDIEGEDLNGVAFKLSDYRGKVVLIDFWGNW